MTFQNPKQILFTTFKWILICALIGILSGSASAFFLISLEWVTQFRIQHDWIIWLLPIGGLLVGLSYHYWGASVVKGNNLLLEEYEKPQKVIPFRMAPLVLLGTLITHLFGGSAGREGTAVQMGGAIADQFTKLFNLNNSERKILIILGISAGFASVFGTPLAGAIFALEVLYFSKINLKSMLLSFLVAYAAYFTVEFWHIKHTHYHIPEVPEITFTNLLYTVIIGVLSGLAALLFSRTTHFWGSLFSKKIKYPPFRPFVGGIVLAIAIAGFGFSKFSGLGVPVIVASFSSPNPWYDFLLKILFTGFTLGAGFKGGEVTPLFFVGATLGSALSLIIPLPIALLAGMGFVAVFSGATHTPIACTIMGLELFGIQPGIFIAIACTIAYFSSGSVGIYKSQIVKGAKYKLYQKWL
ncbi:voltage-gated chloride channel family protein [Flavobacterium sp. Fl-77]|uniref:Voltage-gated chloride channel family protein n=1 Tax=Flavobacterium flavipigmentatum TaxID=2893884 RepID=A0AAJ2VXF4_9FLAO|nr:MULTISPECIES: voltage-gated chloride channel family protein [unclassified Flavobacterium]MDX6181807.1 voltage-gated chloride channel family protein [Flavobacterium sp. Fl-33]MDX6185159.1 voltage-gated chloride channel family protein [Flavobacterium sp. Fl-77]UFH37266.1 voltage-gated chloride channel family protein [Flavobacterium sp. F-70]